MSSPQRHGSSKSDFWCIKGRLFNSILAFTTILNVCVFIFMTQFQLVPKCEFHFSKIEEVEAARQWHEECPQIGGGPRGVVITVVPGGRLGNHVFEYLSVWAVARRYNVWPAVPKLILKTLYKSAFTSLAVPSLEDLVKRCNLDYLLVDMKKIGISGNKDDLFEAMKFENNKRVSIVVLRKYMIATEYINPYWVELSNQLIFQDKYLESSQKELEIVTQEMKKRIIENVRIHNMMEPTGYASSSDIQYVAVHVRRTDYISYIKRKYKGVISASTDFFLVAMEEMRRRLKPREIIFVVVSDDPQWCHDNLHGPDVIVAGNGDINSPGHDLALLAACNHTIMAYGTFGLTVALHNKNGLTITYDTKSSKGSTAAMAFARSLPNWLIL